MKITVCALGQKGYKTLMAINKSGINVDLTCIIGRDNGVSHDYSCEIVDYCEKNNITHCLKGASSFLSLSTADYVFAAGWRWMIREIPEHRLIVFHDSLLPRYRGFAPLVNALLNKENKIGVTALFGGENYDTGRIISQRFIEVAYPVTIGQVIERISDLYSDLAFEVLHLLRESSVQGDAQDESQASYSLWRNNQDYRIDWCLAADEISHFVDCLGYPYLGASSKLDDRLVRFYKVKPLEDVLIENRAPGKVIFINNGRPVVVCGKGLLSIEDARFDEGDDLLPVRSIRTVFR